jgi:hypothetical protein
MKHILVVTALGLVFAQAHAQSSQTTSTTQSNSMGIGGGASSSVSQGGAGGSGGNGSGGAATSAVTVNLGASTGSGDPSSDPNASRSANAQQTPTSSTTDLHERVTTVGNPGSSSYGVSFSQYNCASTAGAGVGFMGGAFQFGVGKESDPCNARANAAALFSIAQTLATSNPSLSAQLFRAAILLVGNSTGATKEALATAGVTDFATNATTTPTPAIVPPVTPPPADESKALPVSPAAQVAAAAVPAPAIVVPAPVTEAPAVDVTPATVPDLNTGTPLTMEDVRQQMFKPATLH